jgi:hypothetical protein
VRTRFASTPRERKPGVWYYRGYTITRAPAFTRMKWEFTHEDYDGAPMETGGPPADKRFGHEHTLEETLRTIDELEDE